MNTPTIHEEEFTPRHIGPDARDIEAMLRAVGAPSLDALIDETVPPAIRTPASLPLPEGISEHRFLGRLKEIASLNRVYASHIGLGYYDCVTPPVIQRNILENPGWYTQYTPYQAEVSQGRLEALLNFQTMVMDLTGMEVANASLLDEGTAAAEAMIMAAAIVHRSSGRAKSSRIFVSEACFPQTIDVIRTRAVPLGFEVVVGDHRDAALDEGYFGVVLQYPGRDGEIHDHRGFIARAHELGILAIVAADILSLVHLVPPGEFGADIAVGSTQRFGVPMGFGGPHAAYFATRSEYIRQLPGRIIGVSIDAHGNRAYRMTLQTREQHIRREKATSNICTAQALLAIMAGMYAVYHGPDGLRRIAANVHTAAAALAAALERLGYARVNGTFFDTVTVAVPDAAALRRIAEEARLNFRYDESGAVGVSVDETTTADGLAAVVAVFARAAGKQAPADLFTGLDTGYPSWAQRTTDFLAHPVFHRYHSETAMMRYIKRLENRDISLTHSMISLGSCTMKLNAAAELLPITWEAFARMHPFAPLDQAAGYLEIFRQLEQQLCAITGFTKASFQPNAGAQGEYTGLLVIRAYHHDRGEPGRNVTLIPSSAHGTNPASAVMAGMQVVVVACDDQGNIDVDDLRAKAETHRDTLAALMVTYPSTHGVFEQRIREICEIVHAHGGQVYMDGANLNAQVGLTSPAFIGADVCHINLHKTFAIPHGGGGPGMGPICTAAHLAPYLPGHPLVRTGGEKAITAVSSAPWGSSDILVISYGYNMMLGARGLTEATRVAILNANYLKSRLEQHYRILYQGNGGRVAHEFIVDLRPFKDAHIEAEDIAKRLMDYGFHAPTVSFPVAGTLMIEPTESEPLSELDRFAETMISIRDEIQEVMDGSADPNDNVLKNAPHTAADGLRDDWTHPYSRRKAVYPLPGIRENKFWPAVARINNSYGDRNVVCSCPPVEEYATAAV